MTLGTVTPVPSQPTPPNTSGVLEEGTATAMTTIDARLAWTTGGADLVLDDIDVAGDGSLIPALLVSLFSDARAPTDPNVPVAEQDLRGWWAEDQGTRHGSLLWLLERAKDTPETRERARATARAALQWLIDDGIATSVDVAASQPRAGVLLIQIKITRGTAPRWAALWRATRDQVVTFGTVDVALAFP